MKTLEQLKKDAEKKFEEEFAGKFEDGRKVYTFNADTLKKFINIRISESAKEAIKAVELEEISLDEAKLKKALSLLAKDYCGYNHAITNQKLMAKEFLKMPKE